MNIKAEIESLTKVITIEQYIINKLQHINSTNEQLQHCQQEETAEQMSQVLW